MLSLRPRGTLSPAQEQEVAAQTLAQAVSAARRDSGSASTDAPAPVSVVMRSRSTVRGDIMRDVHGVRDYLFADELVSESGAVPPFNLLLLLSDPSISALEDNFFGTTTKTNACVTLAADDTTGAGAFLELRESGDVAATGISCHPLSAVQTDSNGSAKDGDDHHHKVINRFLQDPSFLADVVDTGHVSDWSMNHCRLLCHGHRGEEKISADNQLHAAAHLGAAVLLNMPQHDGPETRMGWQRTSRAKHQPHHRVTPEDAVETSTGVASGSVASFCADHGVSEAELALYLEVGPPAPSPPISATFRDAHTPDQVDDLVEMMQILHQSADKRSGGDEAVRVGDRPNGDGSAKMCRRQRRRQVQVAANAWMGLRAEHEAH